MSCPLMWSACKLCADSLSGEGTSLVPSRGPLLINGKTECLCCMTVTGSASVDLSDLLTLNIPPHSLLSLHQISTSAIQTSLPGLSLIVSSRTSLKNLFLSRMRYSLSVSAFRSSFQTAFFLFSFKF